MFAAWPSEGHNFVSTTSTGIGKRVARYRMACASLLFVKGDAVGGATRSAMATSRGIMESLAKMAALSRRPYAAQL